MKVTDGQKMIKQVLSRLKNLDKMAVQSFFKGLEPREDEVEVLNRGQLFQGEYTNSNKIKPDYTPTTKRIKRAKSQPFDRVTLRDTGSFYRGIQATVSKKDLTIESTDDKTDKLFNKYGSEELLGLNETNHNSLVNKTIPIANVNLVAYLKFGKK
jgi:hypothetical protein